MALTLGTGRRGHRVVVEVYTRQGCGLCQEAERRAAREAGRRSEVRLVDVDQDPELARRYGDRVPVVVVDGREVSAGPLSEGVVARAVRRARRARWAQWRRA